MTVKARLLRLTRAQWTTLGVALALLVGVAFFAQATLAERAEARALRVAAYAEAAAQQSEHAAFTALAAAAERQTLELGPGVSLSLALAREGIPWAEVERATKAVTAVFDPYRLREGREVDFTVARGSDGVRLTSLAFYSDPGQAVTVNRTWDGAFLARESNTPTKREVAYVNGEIRNSFYASALKAGATDREVAEVADVFAYDLDFQRDLRLGDTFEMVFEREFDELDRTVSTGELMFVGLQTGRGVKAFYRFKAPGDRVAEWYDAAGRTAKKFLMRTPINGARLSSNFGMRRHPILGYSKLHQGTDFAAPTGTPILAAGDGVITRAGWHGGYGRYVSIKHDQQYTTAYAHMSGFARGVRSGARVRQGQVIGYVGTTGRSTGPHLHYEVLYRGRHINPMSMRVPTGRNLTGQALAAFQVERARIDALRQAQSPQLVAAAFESSGSGRRAQAN